MLTVNTVCELCPPHSCHLSYGMISKPSNNNYQSIASYTCNNGYVITPNDGGVRVCGEDGEWAGVAPACPRELIMVNC